MQVLVPVKYLKDVSARYRDSYFTAAISFAEIAGKDEIDIDYDSTYFIELANRDGQSPSLFAPGVGIS